MLFARLVDWTWNADGSYGPGVLSWYHFLWLFIAVAGSIGVVFLAKHQKIKRQDDWVILGLDIFLIISEIPKQILYNVEYYGYLRIDTLPFSFCSIPMFIALIGALMKEGKVKNACYTFLSFYGIIGGASVLCYATTLNTPFVYISFQTMFWHSILVWMGVYLIAAKKYGQDYRHEALPPFFLFLALSFAAVVGNEAVYYGYLKDAQTPVMSIDELPGAYEYYKYGCYDENDGSYLYLKVDGEGSISTTEDVKDATNFVVTFPDGDNSDIYYITYENANEETCYLEIKDTSSGLSVVTSKEPTMTWAFGLVGEHYVFASDINGESYCLAYGADNSVMVSKTSAFPADCLEPDFIKVTVEREGDAANFFFVSNHCPTSIPVLDLIQPHVHYVLFILIYQASLFAVGNGVWGIAHLIRIVRKQSEQNE